LRQRLAQQSFAISRVRPNRVDGTFLTLRDLTPLFPRTLGQGLTLVSDSAINSLTMDPMTPACLRDALAGAGVSLSKLATISGHRSVRHANYAKSMCLPTQVPIRPRWSGRVLRAAAAETQVLFSNSSRAAARGGNLGLGDVL